MNRKFGGVSCHFAISAVLSLALGGGLVSACDSGTSVNGASIGTGTNNTGGTGDGGAVNGADGSGTAEVTIVGGDSGVSGADGSAVGPGDESVGVSDGTVAGDGGQTGSDVVPVDPAMSCVGKCGQAQPNQWKCQCDAQCAKYKDCCSDLGAVCKSDPPPTTDPAAIIGCLQKSCADTVAACKANPTCAQFWECAASCKDSNCMQTCAQKFDLSQLGPLLTPLQECGQKAGCFGGQVGPGPTGPVCGDGKCEQPENSLNCAKDCPNTPPGDAQKCLYDKCKDAYTSCFEAQPCVAAVACINTGKQANQCVSDKATGGQLNTLLTCGDKNGCFGGTTGAQCGNAKCEPGETYVSCAKDCPTPPPPTDALTKCVADKCKTSYAACVTNDGCAKALSCVGAGGNMQTCAQQAGNGTQQLLALGQCAYQNGCLTDTGGGTTDSCKGKCGQFTPNAKCQCNTMCKQFGNCCTDYDAQCGGSPVGGSCTGKCGQFTPGAACQCNAECTTFKNCCGDFDKVCGTTPTPAPVCGDGVCTAPTESSTTCPKDCGAPPAKACKSKADCLDSEICCGKADGTQVCLPAGQCK